MFSFFLIYYNFFKERLICDFFFLKMGFLIVFEGAKRLQLKLHVFSIPKESGEAVCKFLFLDLK